ncbi:alpha/beta hydrolase [Pseudonocardia eucalypti]|uniref:Alpha/beta hydrolase n=1 Tax=Pseudonocardia eucalypti TaxID=648755 RepID=A0ABP9QJT1_9PSEU|nr:pimeloyl-ACP methyl ester carboxylesterase [Pseudonocardia eucalypti]
MTTLGPIVLVHGYWHGSWCWAPVTEELAARGLAAVAVDMAGHGLDARSPAARWSRPFDAAAYATEPAPSAAVTVSSAATRLVEQVRRIGGGRPCLVVAHSMGGTVATAMAELAPELVAGLVYVSAFAPTGGRNTGEYIQRPENAGSMVHRQLAADAAAGVGSLRLDTGDPSGHPGLIETFYADVPTEVATAAIAMLAPDAPIGIGVEPLNPTAERYGRLPHTYVVCTRDNAITPALQRLMAAGIDALSAEPTTVVELECSHAPFLSQPAALVDVLEKAQREVTARA